MLGIFLASSARFAGGANHGALPLAKQLPQLPQAFRFSRFQCPSDLVTSLLVTK